MSVVVTIGRDDAMRDVNDVHTKLTSPEERRALMKNIGVRAEAELRGWFYKRDAEDPNKMGWPRQHFWVRKTMKPNYDPSKTTENSATVVVSDPALAAKVNGATIRPLPPHRALAIPMHPNAYGVLPRSGSIPGLFFLRSTETNGGYLVRKEGEGKSANLTFYYRLVPEVTVPKDPQALPPVRELGAALGQEAERFFLRQSR